VREREREREITSLLLYFCAAIIIGYSSPVTATISTLVA
jgi:hypothetical protein